MGETRGVVNEVPVALRSFAKRQRSGMTRAEALFWAEVRAGRLHGYKVKRQVAVTPYIVDFLCASERLIVELDGPPHESQEARARDVRRDGWLTSQGFMVLRFTNDEVLGNCDLVLEKVRAATSFPSPAEGERERRGGTLSPLAGEGGCASSRERERV